jgi:hypothetical protein
VFRVRYQSDTKPSFDTHPTLIVIQLWMNLNWVNIQFHLGDPFFYMQVLYIGRKISENLYVIKGYFNYLPIDILLIGCLEVGSKKMQLS